MVISALPDANPRSCFRKKYMKEFKCIYSDSGETKYLRACSRELFCKLIYIFSIQYFILLQFSNILCKTSLQI